MIDLYTAATPNGRKISIMLEEVGLDYNVHYVDLQKEEQFTDAFLAISPNNKIPAIVDQDNGASVMESGAILIYLAEKTGQLLPTDPARRAKAMEWTFWQVANIGPAMGQANHFATQAPQPQEYALTRFLDEAARCIKVMDKQLSANEWLAGDSYSIADIAAYPWVVLGFDLIKATKAETVGEAANTKRWLDAMTARDAVQRGLNIPKSD